MKKGVRKNLVGNVVTRMVLLLLFYFIVECSLLCSKCGLFLGFTGEALCSGRLGVLCRVPQVSSVWQPCAGVGVGVCRVFEKPAFVRKKKFVHIHNVLIQRRSCHLVSICNTVVPLRMRALPVGVTA